MKRPTAGFSPHERFFLLIAFALAVGIVLLLCGRVTGYL